jgi:hypothetical protein
VIAHVRNLLDALSRTVTPSSVRVLSGLEHRLYGATLQPHWLPRAQHAVHFETREVRVLHTLFAQRFIEGMRALVPHATLSTSSPDIALLAQIACRPDVAAMNVVLGSDQLDSCLVGQTLHIPWRIGDVAASDYQAFERAALNAGVELGTSSLALDLAQSQARQWIRRTFGISGKPLFAYARSDRDEWPHHVELQNLCRNVLGAQVYAFNAASPEELPVGFPLPFFASVLKQASVVIAEEGAAAHIAASAGVPSLVLVPHARGTRAPYGPHVVRIVEELPQDFAKLDPASVLRHVEQLSSIRFPFDLLDRVLV